MPTKPETEPKRPRTRSPQHAAASICVELAAIDAAEAKANDALKQCKERRAKATAGASAEVLRLVEAMRGAGKHP